MKPRLLILIAFIMNACMMQPATNEDMNMANPKKAWSASATLVADGKSRSSLQALFEDAPGDYVIQFNVDISPVGGARIAAEADITWSVEGNSVTRTVSLANGTRVSGCGQGVKVLVRDVSDGVSPTSQYAVSTLITQGTRPSVTQPPIFAPAGHAVAVTTAAPTVNVTIPTSVGVISYYITYLATTAGSQVVLTEAQFSVLEMDSASNNLKFFSPVVQKGFIPITPGSTTLQFALSNMAANSNITIEITWGVEG